MTINSLEKELGHTNAQNGLLKEQLRCSEVRVVLLRSKNSVRGLSGEQTARFQHSLGPFETTITL